MTAFPHYAQRLTISMSYYPPPQRAKEAYIIPTLPWLRAVYLHREQQSHLLHEVALAALHAATSAGRAGHEAMAEAAAAVLVTAAAGQPQRSDAQ